MSRPALLRRRTIWLPTAAGWVLLVLALAGVALALARGAYPWLALDAPQGRGLLVVEGWLPAAALDGAAARFASGAYDAIATVGGPLEPEWGLTSRHATYAERGADYLRRRGVDAARVLAVPSPPAQRDRTWGDALALRRRLLAGGPRVEALDVYTLGPHARRSRALYRRALGDPLRVGVIAARPTRWDADAWWRSSRGARAVISEAVAWLRVACCFRPGVP